MGEACSSCGCNEQSSEFQTNNNEVQYDNERKISKPSQEAQQIQLDLGYQKQHITYGQKQTDKQMLDKFRPHLKQIIKIQSLYRRNEAIARVAMIRQSKTIDGRYFTAEEHQECLRIQISGNKSRREQRPTYTFKCSGATYTGEWIGNVRDGFGRQIWSDGAVYEGFWRQNHASEKGKFTHIDGDVYEGDWVKDKANGYGTYQHTNGARYEGYWNEDLQHGDGKESWSDGSVYMGQYQKGKKHGHGVYKWNDESQYEGQWYENKIRGLGVYRWRDGRMYKGEWTENNMDGFGIYSWADGRKYQGYYKDDKKHGFGIYQWADGRVYAGNWSKGKQHGLGTYCVPTQQKKFGLWEEGKRIEWFTEDQVQQIESGIVDYIQFFKKDESVQGAGDFQTNFQVPSGFDKKVQRMIDNFENFQSVQN